MSRNLKKLSRKILCLMMMILLTGCSSPTLNNCLAFSKIRVSEKDKKILKASKLSREFKLSIANFNETYREICE